MSQGSSVWNDWRKKNPDVRPNFVRADLSGANLSDCDLRQTFLFEANLSGANLSRANLELIYLVGMLPVAFGGEPGTIANIEVTARACPGA